MLDLKKIENLGDLIQNSEEFNQKIKIILEELKNHIELQPNYDKIEFLFNEIGKSEINETFSIGINRKIENEKVTILIEKEFKKFVPFIVLRELFNLFIPKDIVKSESIQLIINQIIMTYLSRLKNQPDWRELIRSNLKQYHSVVTGFNYLVGYDRLEKFFQISQSDNSLNTLKMFFKYLHETKLENQSNIINLILDKIIELSFKPENNEEMVETLRCLIFIFYNEQLFDSILKFKDLFQEFKDKKFLATSLSLRKFEKQLKWIHHHSMVAPSYQLEYKSINLHVISVFIEFNHSLSKEKINEVLKGLPFLNTPKYYYDGFGLDIYCYIILPKCYLSDFLELLQKLKNKNYVNNFSCLEINHTDHLVNLNYFLELNQNWRFIEINTPKYKTKYEIQFETNYGNELTERKLELIDFLIFDRLRSFSYFGFGFEKRAKTLGALKSDLLNDIITQRAIIKELKETLNLFHSSTKLKKKLLQLIENNGKNGFFHIKKMIENYNMAVKIIELFINDNLEMHSYSEFKEELKKKINNFDLIEKKVLKLKYIEREVIEQLIPLFFRSKEIYLELKKEFNNFAKLFNSFYNLKVFDLNALKRILLNKEMIETLYITKEKKLKADYEKFKLYRITGSLINEKIRKYLTYKPQLIKPIILNTITVDKYVHYFFEIIIINSKEARLKLEGFKNYFPRSIILETKDFFSEEKYLLVELSVPYLSNKEKKEFLSYFYTLFQNMLIKARFYIWTGMTYAFTSKSFYDFEKEQFFYTPDLFKQYFFSAHKILGEINKRPVKYDYQINRHMFSDIKDFSNITKLVNSKSLVNVDKIDLKSFEELMNFQKNMNRIILDDSLYKASKTKTFFSNYVNHLYFIPIFHSFKLSLNFMYFKNSNLDLEELRTKFGKSILKLKYSSSIENNPNFLLSYIQDLESYNDNYLEIAEMGDIQEFCYFQVKKVSFLFDFHTNITDNGWDYNEDFFNLHIKDVLSNQELKPYYLIKDYNLHNNNNSHFYKINSKEYQDLMKIYNWESIDIKSYLLTKKIKTIEIIKDLVGKGLILPYISIKNVGFRDSIYFIIPNIKKKDLIILKGIFSFFNYGFIYEIEGAYKILEQDRINQFNEGLFIKLKLPECKISGFVQLIDLLFEDLDIHNYVILVNLINGSHKIKKVKTTA